MQSSSVVDATTKQVMLLVEMDSALTGQCSVVMPTLYKWKHSCDNAHLLRYLGVSAHLQQNFYHVSATPIYCDVKGSSKFWLRLKSLRPRESQ